MKKSLRVLAAAVAVVPIGASLVLAGTANASMQPLVAVPQNVNPAVATKVSDRGTGQAVGVVTDVGLFLDLLARALETKNDARDRAKA